MLKIILNKMDKQTVRDFEKDAKDRLTRDAYDYYRSGANGMISLLDSERAYDKLYLKTRA
jgi:isopentenyl diphosphate isomerase/L-lactate dehydrogenase-like FMN-dependent dehydrogenase